ncbi:MAG: hypothetical protein ACE5GQ_09650 [Nitrospinales bacterium]
METIISFMEHVVNKLPPLLQLLLGLAVSLAILKALIMVADFYDKKREQK